MVKLVSAATLLAKVIVGSRLGYVTPIIPWWANPASTRNCGSWVLFPLPVSPDITVTKLSWMASMISLSLKYMGNYFLIISYSFVRIISCGFSSNLLISLSSCIINNGSISYISSSYMFISFCWNFLWYGLRLASKV